MMWFKDEPQVCVGALLVGGMDAHSAEEEIWMRKLNDGAQDEG